MGVGAGILTLILFWAGSTVAVISATRLMPATVVNPSSLLWLLTSLLSYTVLSIPWAIRALAAFEGDTIAFSLRRYRQALRLGGLWFGLTAFPGTSLTALRWLELRYNLTGVGDWVPPIAPAFLWWLSCALYIGLLHRRWLPGGLLGIWLMAYHFVLTPILSDFVSSMAFPSAGPVVFGTVTGLSIAAFDVVGLLMTRREISGETPARHLG